MINIIFDGNYLFHKTFGVFAGYGNLNPAKALATKKDQAAFIRKVTIDLCAILKSLPSGGRLIFTIDEKSWRKDYYDGYKSSRADKRGESGDDKAKEDWSKFFELLNDYSKHLETIGFVLSRVSGAEGDDVIWLYSEKLNSIGENCIIVSGDGDLAQLTSMLSNGAWTIVWNSKAKDNLISLDNEWIEKYLNVNEEISLFNMGSGLSDDKELLKSLFNKASVNLVDKRKFLFIKMLSGDPGDDVPSIWQHFPKPESKRPTRITELKAEIIWNQFIESKWTDISFSNLLEDEEFLDWISGYSIRLIKGVDSKENRGIATENLIRNFDLMWLNEQSIPKYVLDPLNEEIDRGISLPRQNIDIELSKILEGSIWENPGNNYVPREHDPFQLF